MKILNESEFNTQRQFGIYLIRCLINNKIYIGSTKQSFRARFSNHRKFLKNGKLSNKLLQSDYNLYGKDNFQFEIIEICKSIEDIETLENSHVLKLKPEYNILKTIFNRSKTNLNKKFTEEHKLKLKEKSKLFKHSDLDKVKIQNQKNATKIKLTNILTNEVKIFDTCLSASKFLNITFIQNFYGKNVKGYLVEVLKTQKKSVELFYNENWIKFDSYEKCDKFLDRWRGFTSTHFLKNAKTLLEYPVKFN